MVNTDSQTGKLSIFLGAAPGVGKTWAMVDAAQEQRAEGFDVVIGNVDTHDRPEFHALLAGLEVIPIPEIEYAGVLFREIPIYAIFRRQLDVCLVHRHAHSYIAPARPENT